MEDYERSVYKCTLALEVQDERVISMDSYDNVLVLGEKKGYI